MSRKQKSAGSEKPKPTAEGSGGKVDNDTNKMGRQAPTQKNEGQRTPESRHDRESHVGSTNQVRARKGGAGGGGSGSDWH
ncbi:MAG: hypothetical protein JWR68_197 [Polaromonas sp.]|nr:hypothetical protein [Polaromonas sp.]